MTDITKNITRNTRHKYRDNKDLIVRLTPQGVLIKLSGQAWSKAALAPFEAVYDMAQKLESRIGSKPVTKVKRGLLGAATR